MIEEIKAVADMIEGLGDKGMTAFIVWLAIDFGKTVVAWGAGAFIATCLIRRAKEAVSASIAAAG